MMPVSNNEKRRIEERKAARRRKEGRGWLVYNKRERWPVRLVEQHTDLTW